MSHWNRIEIPENCILWNIFQFNLSIYISYRIGVKKLFRFDMHVLYMYNILNKTCIVYICMHYLCYSLYAYVYKYI